MGQQVARTIPIGPCQVYINNVRVGSPGSKASLNYAYQNVYGKTGDSTAEVNARKTGETATLQIMVADLKVSQLRYAWANAKDLASNTIQTNNFLASGSVDIRRMQFISNMTGLAITTGLVSLPVTYTSGTVILYSNDYLTEYVQGTDFVTNTNCDGIARTTGGAIASGSNVVVHFDAPTTVGYVRAGGSLAVTEDVIRLVGQDQNGRWFQLKCFRCVREGSMNIDFEKDAPYNGQSLTWHLLADLTTYSPGSQLFEFATQKIS